LRTYADVQLLLRRKASEIYPLYQSGNLEEFNIQCGEVTQNVNQGKITRKQKAKTYSLINSIKMLINLDEDFCKYIVRKHLAKDEFLDLDPSRKEWTV
jgi:transposase